MLHTDTAGAAMALAADDPRLDLERVSCPSMLVWGARDPQVPVSDGFEYSRRLGAPLRVVAGAGHLVIAERPEACLDAIRALLDSCDAATEAREGRSPALPGGSPARPARES